MTATARPRTVILALAFLGHVGLILLLADGIRVVRTRASAREPEPLLLVLLESLVHPESRPVAPEVPAPVLAPPSEVSAGPLPEIDTSDSATQPSVSDSIPRVDWMDERRREVRSVVARQAAEAARPKIGQHAPGMELPHEAFRHEAGVVEHYAGGETIEWINDRCYYTTQAPTIPNYFGLMLPTCKPRGNVPREELHLDKRPRDAE